MTTRTRITTVALSLATLSLVAAAGPHLVCDGVLGNSGEQGATLIRFGDASRARGLGVVVDRFGSLWDRAGAGVLNRYAADGRRLASYRIPADTGDRDQLTRVGDTLVLLVGEQLCTLPVTAPADTAATPTAVRARALSFGAAAGRLAFAWQNRLAWFDPATAAVLPIAEFADTEALDVGPDGALYVQARGQVHRFADGREDTAGWPRPTPGERLQFLGNHAYGHAWHGTIRRVTADLEPAPGVVLGGASGSFIGHLDQNPELNCGRGLAELRPGLLAASGLGGVLHLLAWDDERQQMQIVRRIGAVPACRGLGLDRQGNVWWHAGAWRWADAPDTPLRLGVNQPQYPWGSQVVILDSDALVVPCYLWGKPTFYHGPATVELIGQRLENGCALRADAVGTAVYRRADRLVLLTVDPKGQGQAFALRPDGAYEADLGAVNLELTGTPLAAWTSLATPEAHTLLAAADGHVVQFAAQGDHWRETRRWRADFGPAIHITTDGGRLWIADRDRHRVLVFATGSQQPLAQFGHTDTPGTDLAALQAPETIAARGDRAVVFDSGNQRLLKLSLVGQ